MYKCALRGTGYEVLHGPIDTDLTSSVWPSKTIPRVDTEQCSKFLERTWSTGAKLMAWIDSFCKLCRDETLSARTSPAPKHMQTEKTTKNVLLINGKLYHEILGSFYCWQCRQQTQHMKHMHGVKMHAWPVVVIGTEQAVNKTCLLTHTTLVYLI